MFALTITLTSSTGGVMAVTMMVQTTSKQQDIPSTVITTVLRVNPQHGPSPMLYLKLISSTLPSGSLISFLSMRRGLGEWRKMKMLQTSILLPAGSAKLHNAIILVWLCNPNRDEALEDFQSEKEDITCEHLVHSVCVILSRKTLTRACDQLCPGWAGN